MDPIRPERHTAFDCFLVLSVQVFSLLDLIFTLVHLMEGGWELNPIMALALKGGYASFGVTKMGITTVSLAILVVHIRLRDVRSVLIVLVLLYIGVCVYHLYYQLMIG